MCVFSVLHQWSAPERRQQQPRVVASFLFLFFPPFLSLTWSTARSADRRKHTHTRRERERKREELVGEEGGSTARELYALMVLKDRKHFFYKCVKTRLRTHASL